MMGIRAFFGKETRHKILAFGLGSLALLFLAEAGLRLYGFTAMRMRLNHSLKTAGAAGKTRILCIGESMTFGGYPRMLQSLLDSARPGRFEVIDAAVPGNNSSAILSKLEKDLDRYSPKVVIAMLGCNDDAPYRVLQTPEYQTPVGRLLKSSRIYRLGHYLYELVIKTPVPKIGTAAKDFHGVQGKKFPNETEVDREIGRALNGRDFPRAEKLLLLKLQKSGNRADTWLALGNVYHLQGKWEEGKDAMEKAVALDPGNEDALSRLIEVYIDVIRDYHRAGEYLNRAEELHPNSYRFLRLRGILQLTTGDFAGSVESLRKAVSLDPRQPQLWTALGAAQRRSGLTELAKQSFEKARELDPGWGSAYEGLAEIYATHYHDKKALRKISLAMLNAAVPDAAPYATAADFASGMGMHDLAEQLFKKALSVNPDDPQTHTIYGRYLENIKKNPEKALKHFQAAALASAQFQVFRGNLILAKERMGMRDESLLRKHADTKPTDNLVKNYRAIQAILDRRGLLLFAMQYPMRRLHTLKGIFLDPEKLFFISNENFIGLVKENGYSPYFRDMFAGDFGHCSEQGNRLMAENAARAILMAVPDSRTN